MYILLFTVQYLEILDTEKFQTQEFILTSSLIMSYIVKRQSTKDARW